MNGKTIIPTGGYKMNFLAYNTASLKDAEFRLLTLLLDRWREGGWFPSLTTLAKWLGWDKRKVRQVRDSLAEKGIISFMSGTGHDNSNYTLDAVEAWWAARRGDMMAPKEADLPDEGAIISPPIALPESTIPSKEQDRAQEAAKIRQVRRAVPVELALTLAGLQQIPTKP